MTILRKAASAIALSSVLSACTPSQPAQTPQKGATEIRSKVDETLAQIGTDRQGIQPGPNPDTIYSVRCGKGLIEDQTESDVYLAARRQLQQFACPSDPGAYIPPPSMKGRVCSVTRFAWESLLHARSFATVKPSLWEKQIEILAELDAE